MILAVLVAAGLFGTSANAQCQSDLSWRHEPEFTGASGHVIYNGLERPRGIRADANGHLLVIERQTGVIALTENVEGCSGWTKSVVVRNGELNHGLAINGTALYASSGDAVWQWEYNPQDATVSGEPRTLVTGMGLGGDHRTRTLALQPGRGGTAPYLIVSAGSSENLEEDAFDAEHGTAQVRRFALNDTIPSEGYEWLNGELVAWGMRNAVAMVVDDDGEHLWTVENSQDNTRWNGIDVHRDNPSEELNLVDLSDIGHFYGYPRCFTAFDMQSVAPDSNFETGDQFSIHEGTTDEWCQDTSNVVPPVLSLQAHTAPLDIVFYDHDDDDDTERQGLSEEWDDQAFVSLHGSWNRDEPTGYGIVRVPFNDNRPSARSTARDGYSFVGVAPDLSKCPDGCWRPVGLAFDNRGRLFGTSDTTGEVFVIQAPGSEGDDQSGAFRLSTAPLAVVGFVSAVVVAAM